MYEQAIKAVLKSQLHARMVHYDVFWFDNESAAVMIRVRGSKLTIVVPYIIDISSDGKEFTASSYEWTATYPTLNAAVTHMVKDMRRQEVKYAKFSQ